MHNQRGREVVMPSTRLLLALLLVVAPASLRADQTDDHVLAQMKEFHLPGLSLVVIKDGTIIKAQGYGLANVAQRTPVQPETVFKIGSVSKQFIATGIMLLAEDRRLGLDDLVSKYLKGTPSAWAPITIRHLLTHTAGLVRESPGFEPFKTQSDADVIKAAYSVPLRFTPGEKWEYSNLGYYALAEIISVVAGKPWSEFLDERVFRPAALTTTMPTNTKKSVTNRALGYDGNDNAKRAADWTALRPSGAFLSTTLDLARWEAVLYTDRVLSASVRQQMWTAVRLNNGTTAPYGFGWHVDSLGGRTRVWHGGGLPGFSAQFVRFPDQRLTIIALTNGSDGDLASIVNGIAATLYLPPAASRGQ
jgi:CubicO group peptidase (beta-lactamase class C family)